MVAYNKHQYDMVDLEGRDIGNDPPKNMTVFARKLMSGYKSVTHRLSMGKRLTGVITILVLLLVIILMVPDTIISMGDFFLPYRMPPMMVWSHLMMFDKMITFCCFTILSLSVFILLILGLYICKNQRTAMRVNRKLKGRLEMFDRTWVRMVFYGILFIMYILITVGAVRVFACVDNMEMRKQVSIFTYGSKSYSDNKAQTKDLTKMYFYGTDTMKAGNMSGMLMWSNETLSFMSLNEVVDLATNKKLMDQYHYVTPEEVKKMLSYGFITPEMSTSEGVYYVKLLHWASLGFIDKEKANGMSYEDYMATKYENDQDIVNNMAVTKVTSSDIAQAALFIVGSLKSKAKQMVPHLRVSTMFTFAVQSLTMGLNTCDSSAIYMTFIKLIFMVVFSASILWALCIYSCAKRMPSVLADSEITQFLRNIGENGTPTIHGQQQTSTRWTVDGDDDEDDEFDDDEESPLYQNVNEI